MRPIQYEPCQADMFKYKGTIRLLCVFTESRGRWLNDSIQVFIRNEGNRKCWCDQGILLLLLLSLLSFLGTISHCLSLSLFIIFHPSHLTLPFHLCLFFHSVFSVFCPSFGLSHLLCPSQITLVFSLFFGGSLFFHFLVSSYMSSSSFCYFKMLVQFSSRAVVGLKAARWCWAPVLAHQTVDVGSSHRPHSLHGPGLHTRLQIPPQCTLCQARPLGVPADWAAACRSTTPSATAVPATSPLPSLASAQSPFWARAMESL